MNVRRQRVVRNRVPREILESVALNKAIATLPANYNFEIHKTVADSRGTVNKSHFRSAMWLVCCAGFELSG